MSACPYCHCPDSIPLGTPTVRQCSGCRIQFVVEFTAETADSAPGSAQSDDDTTTAETTESAPPKPKRKR